MNFLRSTVAMAMALANMQKDAYEPFSPPPEPRRKNSRQTSRNPSYGDWTAQRREAILFPHFYPASPRVRPGVPTLYRALGGSR